MKLNILLVSNQVRGIDGTGGLGDVAAALPKVLATRGDIDVRVLTPGYRQISEKGNELDDRFNEVVVPDFKIPIGNDFVTARMCKYTLPKARSDDPEITCYLLRADGFDKAADSCDQAILLCRGTIEFLKRFEDFRPDVIHCNDWHSGLIPAYLNSSFVTDFYLSRIATLYTTHNTGRGYQGEFPSERFPNLPEEILEQAGFPTDMFRPGTRSLEHERHFNCAKGGFGFADIINTVSMQYAKEILTPAFSGGFDGLFRERAANLCGIVDGIDIAEWDPASDENIKPYNYSRADDVKAVLSRKLQIKGLLKDWVNKKTGVKPFERLNPDSVLLALVGRIADQKFPILLPQLSGICQLPDVQFVMLGSAHPDDDKGRDYAEHVRDLAGTPKLTDRLLFFEGFNIELSHIIYAAADIFLVPSSYEPCGLTQLISMRYGTVPVVRFVGGLVDTVVEYGRGDDATGFGFREESNSADQMADIKKAADLLLRTVEKAVLVKKNDTERWLELVRNGMSRDSSWCVSASQYVKLYHAAVARRVNSQFFIARAMGQYA